MQLWLPALGRTPFSLCLGSVLSCPPPPTADILYQGTSGSHQPVQPPLPHYLFYPTSASLFSPLYKHTWHSSHPLTKALLSAQRPFVHRVYFTFHIPSLILAHTSHRAKANHDGLPWRCLNALHFSCKSAWNSLQLVPDVKSLQTCHLHWKAFCPMPRPSSFHTSYHQLPIMCRCDS